MPKTIWNLPSGPGHPHTSALAKLLGEPIPQEPLAPLTPEEQLLVLVQHLETLSTPKQYSAYSTDFYRFLMECVWTRDEARGGRVAQIPPYPFLKDLCEDLIVEEKLFIEKSRRVLATWVACAFDVWIAAGGQDPRWPVLLNARGNRQVYLCHRKFEDADKCMEMRTWFILQQLMERNIWAVWPDFPHWTRKEGEIRGTNGSFISAVPQGPDQLRWAAATLLHIEELAFMEAARPTIESALPVLRGGGHVVAITTPQANSYARAIRDGSLRHDWTNAGLNEGVRE